MHEPKKSNMNAMAKSSSTVQKYLRQYAEPEAKSLLDSAPSAQLSQLNTGTKHYCLVIPAYKESPEFVLRLLQHPDAEKLCIIIVVNQPQSTPYERHKANQELWTALLGLGAPVKISPTIYKVPTLSGATLYCVDRFTQAHTIPKEAGVGLARKLGADIATALFERKVFHHPVIFSTDADVHLPDNYFSAQKASYLSRSAGVCSGWVYDYRHVADPVNPTSVSAERKDVTRATEAYEQAIKYYRDGLVWAGSPYGFHTLGSTLATSILAYCQVRGFPKRPAGEDFYLLNKLAKVGEIENLTHCELLIEARTSNRVPFGTGPATLKILEQWQQNETYCYYHPSCFILLKSLLELVDTLAQFQPQGEPYSKLSDFIQTQGKTKFEPDQVHLLVSTLKALRFEKVLSHTRKQGCSPQQFTKQFHDWFDGFITLKFIRHLSKTIYPDQPLDTCVDFAHQHFYNS